MINNNVTLYNHANNQLMLAMNNHQDVISLSGRINQIEIDLQYLNNIQRMNNNSNDYLRYNEIVQKTNMKTQLEYQRNLNYTQIASYLSTAIASVLQMVSNMIRQSNTNESMLAMQILSTINSFLFRPGIKEHVRLWDASTIIMQIDQLAAQARFTTNSVHYMSIFSQLNTLKSNLL